MGNNRAGPVPPRPKTTDVALTFPPDWWKDEVRTAFPPEVFSARMMPVADKLPEEMDRKEVSGLLPCTMWRPMERLPTSALMDPVEKSTDP